MLQGARLICIDEFELDDPGDTMLMTRLIGDLVATGSVVEARSKGKARLEGKDYVMQDGDVVEFRFNV